MRTFFLVVIFCINLNQVGQAIPSLDSSPRSSTAEFSNPHSQLTTLGPAQLRESLDSLNESSLKETFRWATKTANLELVKRLLSYPRFDPSYNNQEALRYSCQHGYDGLVKMLLEHDKVDPTVLDNAPIRLAAESGKTEVVSLLLKDLRVDPSADNNYALSTAMLKHHASVVETLLRSPKIASNFDHSYSIQWASQNGHASIVQYLLLDETINPAADENLAFRYAAANGHLKVVNLLLDDQRVDPSAMDSIAIRDAVHNGHVPVVERLLRDSRVYPGRAIKDAAISGRWDMIEVLYKDPRVQHLIQNNYYKTLKLPPIIILSKIQGSHLLPGKATFSVSFGVLENITICSMENLFQLSFSGSASIAVEVTSARLVAEKYCILNLSIGWPDDDMGASLLSAHKISIGGFVRTQTDIVKVISHDFEIGFGSVSLKFTHPTIANTSLFFVGENMNPRLNGDQFDLMLELCHVVDSNALMVYPQEFKDNDLFMTFDVCTGAYSGAQFSTTKVASLGELVGHFTIKELPIKFRVNTVKAQIVQAESLLTVQGKKVFQMNEAVNFSWDDKPYYVGELLKREIGIQAVTRDSSRSVVYRGEVVKDALWIPPFFAINEHVIGNPFGDYELELVDLATSGKIRFLYNFPDLSSFSLARPPVTSLSIDFVKNRHSLLITWDSEPCAAQLHSNSSLRPAIINNQKGLEASLVVKVEPLENLMFSVDLESYCSLRHEINVKGVLMPGVKYKLFVELIDKAGTVLASETLYILLDEIIEPKEESPEKQKVAPKAPKPVVVHHNNTKHNERKPVKEKTSPKNDEKRHTSEHESASFFDDPLKLGALSVSILLALVGGITIYLAKKRKKAVTASSPLDNYAIQSNSIFSTLQGRTKIYSY